MSETEGKAVTFKQEDVKKGNVKNTDGKHDARSEGYDDDDNGM